MKTGHSYSIRLERLATERQQALIRILLSVVTSGLLIWYYLTPRESAIFDDFGRPIPVGAIDLRHVIALISVFMVYSLVVWAVLKWKPDKIKVEMAITSVVEVLLITLLMKSPAAASVPFYLWYIFYVSSVASRYGWRFSVFSLAASFASFAWTICGVAPGELAIHAMQLYADIGFMCFLMIMAFLFGQTSERQFAYQTSLAVVSEFRADLTALTTSSEIIDHLLDQVKSILKVERAWFLPAQRGADGAEAPRLHSVGAEPVILSAFREGGNTWNVDRVLERRQAILTNNPKRESSFPREIAGRLELRSVAAAPLMVRTTQVGVVYAANRRDRTAISSADLQLLELMAIQTAPVVENAILWERLREAAASEERARIARDLHDGFLQTLAAINIHLERCKLLVQKDSPRALDGIDKIHDIATRGLGEVRAYLSELRVMGPEPSRFKQAVERCSADVAAKAGFEVHVDIHLGDETVPPSVALSAFQILRELLVNAAKHSQAKNVDVRVSTIDGRLTLEVQDDGLGFDPDRVRPEKASQGHMGLVGIEERLRESNGSLTIVSEPGKGTLATAMLNPNRLT